MLMLTLASLASLAFAAPSFESCDAIWAERPKTLAESESCYAALALRLQQGNAPLKSQLEVRESLFAVYAWMVDENHIKDRKLWLVPSERALTRVKEYLALSPDSATGIYWHAVFTSTEARAKDPKVGPPLATLAVVYSVMDELKRADTLDPSLHGYGPARVLGVIYGELPAMFKGDKKIALNYLERAYGGAPDFAANPVELGKFLIKIKRPDDARKVLTAFIETDSATLQPTRVPETKRYQDVARAAIATL